MENKPIKISSLQIENVKRIKAVDLEFSDALNTIGGKNGQGKTSVLDSICYALGGERKRPSNLKRDDSIAPPSIELTLSNGLVVKRSGKNSTLKVLDPEGKMGGQKLLDSFVNEFALDLPKFQNLNEKDKARELLKIIGVGEKLEQLDRSEKLLFDQRHAHGVIADKKAKYAEELECYDDVPENMITANDLIKSQQDILLRNAENQKLRSNVIDVESQVEREKQLVLIRENSVQNAEKTLQSAKRAVIQAEEAFKKACDDVLLQEQKVLRVEDDLLIAKKSASELQDESTDEIEKQLESIEDTNTKIRANLEKEKAEEEAVNLKAEYEEMSVRIEKIRQEKLDLLNDSDLPLEGLSIEDGALTYNGMKWDCMSGAEQMIVSAAIARKLNPNCAFVLLDKLEQMDLDSLKEFSDWLEKENLQAIATRVSTGDECSIIIEDGKAEQVVKQKPEAPSWSGQGGF